MSRRLLASAVIVAGCLPEDTRPPPAEVLVTLHGSEATLRGVTTTDGWVVRFERVLVTIGGVDIEGDGCDEYADGDYFRILDAKLDKPQKLGLIYGLGTCSFELRARNPESDSLVGENVPEELKFVMRQPASDPYEQGAGITFLVGGVAERGGVRKVFLWPFRRRRVGYDECRLTSVEGSQTFTLAGNEKKTIDVQVHADVLLHDTLDPDTAKARFDHLAAADADGDHTITIEELTRVQLADAGIAKPEHEVAKEWKTLGDFVYDGLFPRMVRIGAAGRCAVSLRRGGR